jgi:hypothetical protein
VNNPMLPRLPSLLRELQAEMRRSPRRSHLHELARRRIDAPHEIINWAKRDRRWSFTLAEIMNEPVAMPRELAARLLVAIVDELEQEREAFGEAVSDAIDGNAEIIAVLRAD